MNWGNRLALVITLFVTGILIMVFKAGTFNTDLVATDYYEQELQYQKVIDAGKRTSNLKSEVKIYVLDKGIEILLPEEMNGHLINANIWLYCVADKNKDRRKKVQTSNGKLIMETLPENKGAYEIKLDWEREGVSYYYEEKLIL